MYLNKNRERKENRFNRNPTYNAVHAVIMLFLLKPHERSLNPPKSQI